jgi:hypothetical protein
VIDEGLKDRARACTWSRGLAGVRALSAARDDPGRRDDSEEEDEGEEEEEEACTLLDDVSLSRLRIGIRTLLA